MTFKLVTNTFKLSCSQPDSLKNVPNRIPFSICLRHWSRDIKRLWLEFFMGDVLKCGWKWCCVYMTNLDEISVDNWRPLHIRICNYKPERKWPIYFRMSDQTGGQSKTHNYISHGKLTEKHLIIFCRATAYLSSRIKIVKFANSLYKISRKSSDLLI